MNRQLERASGIPTHPQRAATIASVVIGAVSGLAIGVLAFAGTLVILVGGVAGAVAGAVISQLVRRRARRVDARDAVLDREIGVIGGDLGSVPSTPQPSWSSSSR